MAKKQTPASASPAAAPTTPQGKGKKAAAPAAPAAPPGPETWDTDTILERICDGDRLSEIAEGLGTTLSVLLRWTQRPEIKEAYVATKELRAHGAVERIRNTLFEVKNGMVDPQAGRLIVETEKWLAGKLSPRDYADKGGDINVGVTVSNADAIRKLSQQPVPPLPAMPVPIEEDKK